MRVDWLQLGKDSCFVRGYQTTMRLRRAQDGGEVLAQVRWYRCYPGAKALNVDTAFGATVWDRDERFPETDTGQLGEVPGAERIFDRGVPPLGETGQGTRTPLAWFLHGVPAGVSGPSPFGPCPTEGEAFTLCLCFDLEMTVGTSVTPPEGNQVLLHQLTPALDHWRIMLWTNDIAPDLVGSVYNLDEANFDGYSRQSPSFGVTTLNADGSSTVTSLPLVWTFNGGAPVKVYGWAALHKDSGLLMRLGGFSGAPVLLSNPGDRVVIQQLAVTLRACPTNYSFVGRLGLGFGIAPPLEECLGEAIPVGGATCPTATELPMGGYVGNGLAGDQWWYLPIVTPGEYFVAVYCAVGFTLSVEVWQGACGSQTLLKRISGLGAVNFSGDLTPATFVKVAGFTGSGAPTFGFDWGAGFAPGFSPSWTGALGLGLVMAGTQGGPVGFTGSMGLGLGIAGTQGGGTPPGFTGTMALGLRPAGSFTFSGGYALTGTMTLGLVMAGNQTSGGYTPISGGGSCAGATAISLGVRYQINFSGRGDDEWFTLGALSAGSYHVRFEPANGGTVQATFWSGDCSALVSIGTGATSCVDATLAADDTVTLELQELSGSETMYFTVSAGTC